MNRKIATMTAVLGALLALGAAWSASVLARSRAAALVSEADLAECRRMAGRIARLGERPAMASDQEKVAAEVTSLIERAANRAGIDSSRLVRIAPEPPQRVQDTVYKEKPTTVFLKGVSAEQVVRLAHAVAGGDHRLLVKSIRLSAPMQDEAAGLWTAEVVLAYLIYEPAAAAR